MKLEKKYLITSLVIIVFFSILFRNIILSPVNLGNDLNFVNYEERINFLSNPFLWGSGSNNGFGGYSLIPFLSVPFFNLTTIPIYRLGINNPFILHKLSLIAPIFIIQIFSLLYFHKKILNNKLISIFFILLYSLNPYFLMLLSGGQIGVALSYAFLPALFTSWYELFKKLTNSEKITFLRIFLTTLTFPVMLMLDARVFFLAIFLIAPFAFYLLLMAKSNLKLLIKYFIIAIIPIFQILLLHGHWILPAILVEKVSLPSGYDSSQSAEFFSFTRFAHSITWTNPNYPENIFGKVNEIHPLSLIIPLLAFSALKLNKSKLVLYFSAISLISAFLTKGATPPFTGLYTWAFLHLPGMSLFRDSTKFFIPLSLSYSYLISVTVSEIQNKQFKLPNYLKIIIIIIIFLIIWWPTFSNQIQGALAYRTYPDSYNNLQQYLNKDEEFGRVLWVPQREIYGYNSLTRPAVDLELLTRHPQCREQFCVKYPEYPLNYQFSQVDLENEISLRTQLFLQKESKRYFNDLAIKYVVLIPDYDNQIYTLDYKKNDSLYQQYKNKLDNSPFIEQIQSWDNLLLYKVLGEEHLLTLNSQPINYKNISPTQYSIIYPGGEGKIEFSMQYDPRWTLKNMQGKIIAFSKTSYLNLNYFQVNLPKGEYYISFQGQEYANIGWVITRISLTLFTIFAFSLWIFSKSKN